jgi:peptidoglycan hydrolase CwlO-like protein
VKLAHYEVLAMKKLLPPLLLIVTFVIMLLPVARDFFFNHFSQTSQSGQVSISKTSQQIGTIQAKVSDLQNVQKDVQTTIHALNSHISQVMANLDQLQNKQSPS